MRRLPLASLVILACLSSVTLSTPTLAQVETPAVTAATGTVRIGSAAGPVGQRVSVEVEAIGVTPPGLGAWEIDIAYDPAVVSVRHCSSEADFGACNSKFGEDTVRLAGASASGTGLAGDTILASLSFTCEAAGVSPLILDVHVFADGTIGDPQPIDVEVEHGEITCTAPTPTQVHPTPRPTPTIPPATPFAVPFGRDAQIAFMSNRDGGPEIYVMGADGSGQTRITYDPESNYGPLWSPDGSKILYVHYRRGGSDIRVLDADGTLQTLVPGGDGYDLSPNWSPDGSRVAFVRCPDRGIPAELLVINSDGSGLVNVSNHPEADVALCATDAQPGGYAWSGDGERLVFHSMREPEGLYVVDADGTGLRYLTDGFMPAWSPAGDSIYFYEGTGQGERDCRIAVYAIASAGGPKEYVADVPTDCCAGVGCGLPSLVWSPDGSRLAFSAGSMDGEDARNYEIFTINADGTGLVNLTRSAEDDFSPTWSPDGSRIAFAQTSSESSEIYVMNADGSGQRNLTTSPAWDASPDWRPLVALPSSGGSASDLRGQGLTIWFIVALAGSGLIALAGAAWCARRRWAG